MNQAQHIISLFGGIRPAARKLKKPPSTIQGWWDRGFIPTRQQQNVLTTAHEFDISMTTKDFFSPLIGDNQQHDSRN